MISDHFYPQTNLVVRRTTTFDILVVLTQFLVVEDTRTREFCYPESFMEMFSFSPLDLFGSYQQDGTTR